MAVRYGRSNNKFDPSQSITSESPDHNSPALPCMRPIPSTYGFPINLPFEAFANKCENESEISLVRLLPVSFSMSRYPSVRPASPQHKCKGVLGGNSCIQARAYSRSFCKKASSANASEAITCSQLNEITLDHTMGRSLRRLDESDDHLLGVSMSFTITLVPSFPINPRTFPSPHETPRGCGCDGLVGSNPQVSSTITLVPSFNQLRPTPS